MNYSKITIFFVFVFYTGTVVSGDIDGAFGVLLGSSFNIDKKYFSYNVITADTADIDFEDFPCRLNSSICLKPLWADINLNEEGKNVIQLTAAAKQFDDVSISISPPSKRIIKISAARKFSENKNLCVQKGLSLSAALHEKYPSGDKTVSEFDEPSFEYVTGSRYVKAGCDCVVKYSLRYNCTLFYEVGDADLMLSASEETDKFVKMLMGVKKDIQKQQAKDDERNFKGL